MQTPLDDKSLGKSLHGLKPTHVCLAIWIRRATEKENIETNAGIVRRVLEVAGRGKSVKHVALVTGLKHYLGPFEAYARTGTLPMTPVREEHPRLPTPNFYYSQEDELYAAAERHGFTWSVHRPHTMIGEAIGNAMNMGTTLAAFASLCKETGRRAGGVSQRGRPEAKAATIGEWSRAPGALLSGWTARTSIEEPLLRRRRRLSRRAPQG
ncbi:MAG TPA: hypothetical protein VIJ63_20095 [Roseiarcus sp.]